MKGAIDAAVGRVFARADAEARIPRERKAREALLRRGLIPWLAGIDPDTRSPRRNIARRADIPEEARALIDLLVEERLLTTDTRTTRDPQTGAESLTVTVEPAHEALLRQWGLLEGWITEDFGLLATLEGIKRAARENARANELARAKAEAQRAQAEADQAAAQARFSRKLSRVVGVAAILLALVAVASIALGVLAKREATRAEENSLLARQAADSLVIDIAQGLRNVEGMPTTSVKRILETAKGVVDRLTSNAPEDLDLRTSRVLMLRQFAINYTALGDLATALDFAEASVKGARDTLGSEANGASTGILAFSLITLGRVQTARGTLDTARKAFDEAFNIGEKIGRTTPGDTSSGQIEAQALIAISDLEVMGGDTTEALKAANASVDIARNLSSSQPSNSAWQILATARWIRRGPPQ